MSSFLGLDDSGDPILHFTSDVKTVAQMKGAPTSTSLFHSDLPYIFVRERWRIDSYTSWGSGGGGRKFALPSDLQTFKSNNPNLAFLILLEQSDGSKTVMNPCLQASWYRPGPSFEVCSCINGTDYLYAFTDSDTQLSNITRGNTWPSSLTFRTWDTNDTSITIFRTPFGQEYVSGGYKFGRVDVPATSAYTWDWVSVQKKDLTSSGNACTAIEIVFLNVTNSATTFDRQTGYTKTGITISRDQFDVGGLDMLNFSPLLGRGTYASGATVTPAFGELYGGRRFAISASDITTGFVSSANVVSKNDTPVIEIPPEKLPADTLEIDFAQKYIKRGADIFFDATTSGQGLRVIGTKEVEFTMATGNLSANLNTRVTLSNTQSGTYTETPDANTLYLMSAVYNGVDVLNSALVGVGENPLFCITYAESAPNDYGGAPTFFLDIASDGTVTPKIHRYTGNYAGVSFVNYTFGSIKVRLIALKAS